MKKYCVVSFCNMYILPYASIYIDLIVKNGAECVLLFWDRDNTEGKNDNYPNCQKKCFSYKCDNNTNRINKVKGYLGAKSFFVNELCSEDYDGIIFLQTHAAISCYGVLKKKYIGKYIVDVRDWTLEHISVYRYIEEKCIKNSYRTVISSPAYKDFLPDFHYTVAHNFTPFSNETIDLLREKSMVGQRKQPLSISFVGTVRFIEMNQKILDIFSNDSRLYFFITSKTSSFSYSHSGL